MRHRKPRKHKFGPKKYARALRWRLTVRCADCNLLFAATISEVFTQGNVRCPECGRMQWTKPATIPSYIQQLAKKGWGRVCENCGESLREHAGIKCLFESTVFEGAPLDGDSLAEDLLRPQWQL